MTLPRPASSAVRGLLVLIIGSFAIDAQLNGSPDAACQPKPQAQQAIGEGWRQFRGPTADGQVVTSGAPIEWNETTNVAWKTALPGRGWSSPVVAHGRVWLTTATSEGRETSLRLLAVDAENGQIAQSVEVFRIRSTELLNPKNSHASPTPVVDDERVYVHFGSEGTAALTLDGAIVWKARYRCITQHGNGGSPVPYGDLVIFTCDGADAAFVVGLDARTGKERWKTWRREPWAQAYATPLVIRAGDVDQLVSPGAYYAASYDPRTGKEIWRVGYDDGFSNVPRPIFGHGLAFIATGFQEPSLLAVRPGGKGDVTSTQVAWRLARGVPHTPSPILAGEQLYMVSDAGILSCVDALSGSMLWQARLGGNYSASPVMAGGVIFFSSEEGVTTVVKPGSSFQPIARNVLNGAQLASIAAADRSWFIRTATHLYRIGSASGR